MASIRSDEGSNRRAAYLISLNVTISNCDSNYHEYFFVDNGQEKRRKLPHNYYPVKENLVKELRQEKLITTTTKIIILLYKDLNCIEKVIWQNRLF